MSDLYRKTFDEVHASEALRQEVLNMTKQEEAVVRRQIPRMALIAAIVVLALAGTALAAALPGIQEWFSQQWTKETGQAIHTDQMGLIDRLTDAVGVSATVDGVTVTVDSVTRGEDVLWLLLEAEGLPPEEELEALLDAPEQSPEAEAPSGDQKTVVMGDITITAGVSGPSEAPSSQFHDYRFGRGCKLTTDPVVSDGTYSGWATFQNTVREDGTMTVLMRHRFGPLEGASLLDAADMTLELPGLTWGEIPVTGPFTLEFSLPAIKPARPLTTGGGTAKGELPLGENGLPNFWDTNTMGPLPTEEMTFQSTQMTPTNFTIYWTDQEQTERLHTVGDWYLIMKDGTEVCADTSGLMYSKQPDGQWVSRFLWPVPVDLNQAKSLEYRYGEEVQAFDLK